MSRDKNLTPDEREMYERLRPFYDAERLAMAKSLAAKKDNGLFGQNEFEMRDRMRELGAKALELAANERLKKKERGR